ncbi:alpha/beta fold hydrolase [Microbacterium immunditiarum]|uniref:Pimeloyl-ACP methyl ester carboxylesterase n=1 Tax=Microbacterium immunditiarum TaxID=337480 RepID=A0A7Y9GP67_9MICO|nr:hypothetical protein [Microbacterium immunditiarum]NYE18995.1 pimeloyl-ACP methyl ester carboxylesterase [Microbacterium immunditiarum]
MHGPVAVPTLMLSGSESTPEIRQATDAAHAALPEATVRVLDGHAHIAHRTHPELVAAIVREFVSG